MARRFLMVLLAGLLVGGLAVLVAGGGDDRAGPKGSAATDCDQIAEPGRPAELFVASLDPGETGCFREGTHTASGVIELSAPAVTLTSYPGERATLRGRLRINAGADGAVVEDLLLDGRNPDDLLGPLIYADGVVLRGNEVTNHNTAICVHIDDYPGEPAPRGVLIENNEIHHCGRLPANNHGHGIYLAKARDTVIRGNLIYANADRGIQFYPDADDSLVTGNVIDGNGQGVIFGGDGSSSSDSNVVEGNVISNSTIRYNVESSWQGPTGSGNVARRNCVFGGAGDDGQGGIESPAEGFEAIDNLIADPLFVDRAAGDFKLEDDSPCAELGA